MKRNVLINSHYFEFWENHVDLRQSTIKSQKYKLSSFGDYLTNIGNGVPIDFNRFYYDDDGNTEPIDEEFFDEYFQILLDQGKSKSVLYNTISCLKNFMQFLSDNILIDRNCLRYYKNPYYSLKRQDRMLSLEECERLLAAALKINEGNRKLHLLLVMLLTCGLRASEICKLTYSKIELSSDLIFISEGQKTHEDSVFIFPELKAELQLYFANSDWKSWSSKGNTLIFHNNQHTLSPNTLNKILGKIASVAGIKRKISAHDFRYTTANLMYANGISLKTIQRQMRHARFETTLHYMCPAFQEKHSKNMY